LESREYPPFGAGGCWIPVKVLAIQIWVLCVPNDAGIAGLLTSCSQARAVSAAIVAVAGV